MHSSSPSIIDPQLFFTTAGACLLNASRGTVVDIDALAAKADAAKEIEARMAGAKKS